MVSRIVCDTMWQCELLTWIHAQLCNLKKRWANPTWKYSYPEPSLSSSMVKFAVFQSCLRLLKRCSLFSLLSLSKSSSGKKNRTSPVSWSNPQVKPEMFRSLDSQDFSKETWVASSARSTFEFLSKHREFFISLYIIIRKPTFPCKVDLCALLGRKQIYYNIFT